MGKKAKLRRDRKVMQQPQVLPQAPKQHRHKRLTVAIHQILMMRAHGWNG
jgi:hypothetical protein